MILGKQRGRDMKKLILTLVVLACSACIAACASPVAPSAPFTKPSLLKGEWLGVDGNGRAVRLHGDGGALHGNVLESSEPVIIADDLSLTVGQCRGHVDAIWNTVPNAASTGGGFAFDTRVCPGAGRWVFATLATKGV